MSDTRKMDVISYVKFGQFVRDWSSGAKPRPATVSDFNQTVPADVAQLVGYEDGENINFIDLPAKKAQLTFVIPASEDLADPIPQGTYELPDFYSELAFDNAEETITEKEAFRSGRIADYSTAKCM